MTNLGVMAMPRRANSVRASRWPRTRRAPERPAFDHGGRSVPDKAHPGAPRRYLSANGLFLGEHLVAGMLVKDRVMIGVHIGEIVIARRQPPFEGRKVGRGGEAQLQAAFRLEHIQQRHRDALKSHGMLRSHAEAVKSGWLAARPPRPMRATAGRPPERSPASTVKQMLHVWNKHDFPFSR